LNDLERLSVTARFSTTRNVAWSLYATVDLVKILLLADSVVNSQKNVIVKDPARL